MNTILEKTLLKIEEEADDFDESFRLVDDLLEEYGEENLASRLYSEIGESFNWEIVANLFAILIWSTSDNGHQLTKKTENWLVEGKEPRKIKIALNLDVYPFLESNTMEAALKAIALKHPSLKELCHKVIEQRKSENT